MRVLITGGAGFIGSHLCEKLLLKGLDLVVYDNFSVGKRENVPRGVKIIEGDILNQSKLLSATRDIDIIFHFAAKVSIRDSLVHFQEDARINILGTVNLVKTIIKNHCKKLIFSSSMAVYADSYKPVPIGEEYRTEPISPYGIAKLASEQYVLLMSKRFGFESTVLRFFNTYGIRQTYTPYVGVITIFVNDILSGKIPKIFGNGEQCRDFVHVKDVVQACCLSMPTSKHLNGQIFNVGTGTATSVNEVANLIKKALNSTIEFKKVPTDRIELRNSIAKIKKAEQWLGYKPKFKLEESINEVLDWIKKENRIIQ